MLSEVVNALYITYLATEFNNLSNSSSSSYSSNYNENNNNGRKRRNSGTGSYSNKNAMRSTTSSDDLSKISTRTTATTMTRYLDATNEQETRSTSSSNSSNTRIVTITIVVLVWNMFDYISGFGRIIHTVFDMIVLYHIPRIVFVASSYIIALYYDCYFTLLRDQALNQQQQHSDDVAVHTATKEVSSTSFVVLTWKNFLPRIVRYFLLILPIYPIMAIMISFIFLFVISIFEMLHLSTDILNLPIYYGTLYGPFSYIYYHVKHDIISEQTRRTMKLSTTDSFQPHDCITTTSSVRLDSTIC